MLTSTLDPIYQNSGTVLSGGNLTSTTGGSGAPLKGLGTPLLTVGAGTGKWYWEGVYSSGTNGGLNFGLSTVAGDLNNYVGGDAQSIGFAVNGHTYYNNTDISTSIAESWNIGDVIQVAFDFVNKKAWLKRNGGSWNNNGTYDPATNVGGQDISAIFAVGGVFRPAFGGYYPSTVFTPNYGGTSFYGTVPSGFQAANTWSLPSSIDPTYLNTSLVLSSRNLVAKVQSGSSYDTGLSTPILTATSGTGKWYWESQFDFDHDGILLGVANTSQDLSNYVGSTVNSFGFNRFGYALYNVSPVSTTMPTWDIGVLLCLAVDLINKKIWIRVGGGNWNNDSSANPATNTNGLDLSALLGVNPLVRPAFTIYNTNATWTVNFGGTSFTQTPPSGFQAASTWAANPVLGNSNIQSGGNSSYTVNWPSGTAAGDLVVIFGGHGYTVNVPSGWTTLGQLSGSNFNGAYFSKILSPADITAGSVTVTTGGSYYGVLSAITVVNGSYSAIGAHTDIRNGGGSSTVSISTDSSPIAGDMLLAFGSNRGNSADTASFGLAQQTVSATEASGVLTGGKVTSAGVQSVTLNYASAGSGNYQALLNLVQPFPATPTGPVAYGQILLAAL